MASSPGKLFIVGTPIGNLEDLTFRALRVLREVDVIAAEDTRHTSVLLGRYELRRPLLSCHEFNEARRTEELLDRLRSGGTVALVSDAGMPLLSDPGLRLLKRAIAEDIPVEIIPGPSSLTAALAGAGLPAVPFVFCGFFPHKSHARRKMLARFAPLDCTIVGFESPFRIAKLVADIEEVLPGRPVVIARELTKKFEQFLRGSAADLRKRLEQRPIKGEITVLIGGSDS